MTESQNPTLEQVRARRKAIAEEDAKLESIERNLLAIAEAWESLYHRKKETVALPLQNGPVTRTSEGLTASAPSRRLTKREMIIEALNAPRDLWQQASDIQAYVSSLSGTNVPMSSISPELTGMKNNGTIVRKEKFVALSLRHEEAAKTNEASPVVAGNASEPGNSIEDSMYSMVPHKS